MLSTPQDLPSTGTPPAGLALCATLPVTLWVSQGAPQTIRPVHPSGVQSWAGGSCRSPDPQTPSAATWQGTHAPLLGPRAPGTHNPPHAPTTAHWRTTKVCPCLECPPPPRRTPARADTQARRHLPPTSALVGYGGRQQSGRLRDQTTRGGYPVEPVRYGHTGRGSPPLAQAETQPNPTPPPPSQCASGGGGGGAFIFPVCFARDVARSAFAVLPPLPPRVGFRSVEPQQTRVRKAPGAMLRPLISVVGGRPGSGPNNNNKPPPPRPPNPNPHLPESGKGWLSSIAGGGGGLTLLLTNGTPTHVSVPKAPENLVCITQAHTWQTPLLVYRGHSAKVTSRQ